MGQNTQAGKAERINALALVAAHDMDDRLGDPLVYFIVAGCRYVWHAHSQAVYDLCPVGHTVQLSAFVRRTTNHLYRVQVSQLPRLDYQSLESAQAAAEQWAKEDE
jgi:hypothetical protein